MTWRFTPPWPVHVLDDSCEASVPPGTESLLIAPGLSRVPFPSRLLGPDPVFYTLALVQSLMSIAVFLCGPHWMLGSLGSAPLPFTQHQLQFTELLCSRSMLSEKCIINFVSLGNRAAALIAQEFLPKESQNWRETPPIPIHRCGNWGPRRAKFHATPGLTWDPDTVQDAAAGRRPSPTLSSADTDPWHLGPHRHPPPAYAETVSVTIRIRVR